MCKEKKCFWIIDNLTLRANTHQKYNWMLPLFILCSLFHLFVHLLFWILKYISFSLLLFLFLLSYYCCTGGILWHLQKSLQYITFEFILLWIIHSSLSPLHHSPLSPPLPHSWISFNRSHFSILIHECIIFQLHSPSYTFSLYPPPPTGINPRQDLFYLPVLLFWKNDIFVSLRFIYFKKKKRWRVCFNSQF
jgi:hypothetical protein